MPTGSRLRQSALAVRDELSSGRQQIHQLHDRGLDALQVCRRLTSLVDLSLGHLYEATLADLPESAAAEIRTRVVLVAQGGYGRRQLCPYSDVDLMILHAGRTDEPISTFARRLTQDVFDVGLQLGQCVRTISQATQLARQEPSVGSALVESRHLLGPLSLYDDFKAAFDKLVDRRGPALAQAFVAARAEERLQYGESVYLLEPNVKRSRGGLRDVHLLRWLWYLKTRVADPDRLHGMGVISKFDHRRLMNAVRFLTGVRNSLHFHAQAANDLLARSDQLRLANELGYRGTPGLLPVEQFMRDYFHHTRHVAGLAHRLSELMKPPSAVTRVLEPVLARSVKGAFRIGVREISATGIGQARLKNSPEAVLELVDLARLHDKWIAQDTWFTVYRSAPKYPVDLSATAVEKFLEIMANPLQLGELLRRLHDLGVLEKFVPEFSKARCLLQFNQYHRYTVDEHCIRAVEEATGFQRRGDLLSDVYRQVSEKRVLHLALLVHDLGKGQQADHSEVGREIAGALAERLGMSPEERELMMYLVHKHLLMSHLAFRRDTSQQTLLDRFAADVGTPERLAMLYVVTCADLAAVGPDVFNAWKADVLTQLYRQALHSLAPGHVPAPVDRFLAARADVEQELSPDEQTDTWYTRQLEAFPESYLVGRPSREVAETLRRLRELPSCAGQVWSAYSAESDTVEFVAGVANGRGRGNFSKMAGALSGQGMEILSAETAILADELLLLRYAAHDLQSTGPPALARLQEVRDAMVRAIEVDERPRFREIWGHDKMQADAALSNLANKVRIRCDIAPDSTIVEVFTIDRRGLLYELARALHELELLIRFARISTHIDQVVDVFYVAERNGDKPTEPARLEEIRQRMLGIIEQKA